MYLFEKHQKLKLIKSRPIYLFKFIFAAIYLILRIIVQLSHKKGIYLIGLLFIVHFNNYFKIQEIVFLIQRVELCALFDF